MILQAKDGAWGIKDTHTTAPQNWLQGQWFFVTTGKLAALFHMSPTMMYFLSQIAGAGTLFAVTYILITRFLPKSVHYLATLFALTLELGPFPNYFGQFTNLSSWTPAINDFILLFRHFDLAHHVWAEAAGFASVILVMKAYYKPSALSLLGIFVTTCISIWCVPSIVVTLWLLPYPVFLVWALITGKIKNSFLPIVTAFAAAAISGIQTEIAFSQAGSPWSHYTLNEKFWVTNGTIIQQYLTSLLLYLPFLLLFFIVLPFVWNHWSSRLRLTVILLIAWVLTPFIGIPLSTLSFFPVANFRIIIAPMYISAGILSAIGLSEALHFLPWEKARKTILVVVVGITIGFSMLLTYVYLHSFILYQNDMNPHAYPVTSTWDGMQFLRTIPQNSGIMVREFFGEMLPGFANVRVYIGGTHGFPDWIQRRANTISFFSGTMTEAEAKQFLTSSDISYVFYGPDEQAVTTKSPFYPNVLKPVFQTATVTIFSFKTTQ